VGGERTITDASGVLWEVFREDEDALAAVLEWGHRPLAGSPGLLFSSTQGLRRLSPCPENWREISDAELLQLLERAVTLY
jgi:hypothetical protein